MLRDSFYSFFYRRSCCYIIVVRCHVGSADRTRVNNTGDMSSINTTWTIWFWEFRSGVSQKAWWIILCWNLLQTTIFRKSMKIEYSKNFALMQSYCQYTASESLRYHISSINFASHHPSSLPGPSHFLDDGVLRYYSSTFPVKEPKLVLQIFKPRSLCCYIFTLDEVFYYLLLWKI